jgi:hypothetical protein
LVTLGASEALLVVCVAHGRYNFTLHIVLTDGTFGSESLLIVDDTVVVVVFREEPADGQRLLALDTLKATFVEVFVGHPQHLTGTLFLAFSTINFCFTCETNFIIVSVVISPDIKQRHGRRANQINYHRRN